jgi:hypothetical protein
MNDGIAARIDDARVLWAAGRREGALLSVLVAVAARARRSYPNLGDGDRFRRFLAESVSWKLSAEFRGAVVPVEQIFYKWMRCSLLHEAGLPEDITWIEDGDPAALTVRAGGAPEFVLKLSTGWVDWLAALAAS